jgi:uncharacterized membrane protein
MNLFNSVIFLFLNFCVSFVSDIVLNDLSTHFNIIKSLKPYFQNKSILKCALDAGITVMIGILITMFFSFLLFGFLSPNTFVQLIYFCIIGFLIGYILDILIYKLHVFGNRLDAYYKAFGAGLWGAIAFIFSIIISYFLQKHIFIKI